MTVTIKLDAALEEHLRRTAQASGRSTSDVVRAALQAYLSQADEAAVVRSPYEMGLDLFERHAGPADLATRRRQAYGEQVAARHARRG